MAAILLVGLVAFTQLPISALPQVDYPTIQVLTFYPGASPDVMATTVTAPLERQFGQVQGLSQMTSTSSGGVSVIVLQFSLQLDIDVAEQEVQAAINAAQSYLPSVLPTPPVYSKTNPADAPVLTLAITSNSIPLPSVEDLIDTRLAPKISQLNGVGLVSISGGQKPAVRIQVNPASLSSYGINMEDVRTALAETSVNAAKGNFDGPRQDYQIDANDQVQTSDEYKNVVIAYRDGAPVFVRDVAQVINGVENSKQAAWMGQANGGLSPAVILNVQRQPGANTISVVKSIKKILPQLQANLPAGIEITMLTDLTTAIQASVDDVEFELMLTIGLVVMVIFLFLRNLYATIIPSIAVPLSLIGTFGVMYMLGYSLDNLSLMALTISTGFVVDDAIVMIENISRYLEEGDAPMEAALKGAGQIGFTIVSLTVSLIAVLIPLLFMGDVVGRLFREFAVTLATTIIISAVVSLTLTPMMCSRILRHNPEAEQGRFYRASENVFNRLIAFYGRTLSFVLRYQTITLLVALGYAGADDYPLHLDPEGLFPRAGHGCDPGHIAGAAKHLVRCDGGKAAGIGQADPGGSGRPEPVFFYWGGRHEHHPQQRPLLHQSEATRPARPERFGCDPPAAKEPDQGAGDRSVHAARAEHHGGRPGEPHAVSVHARGSRSQRAECLDESLRGRAEADSRPGRRCYRSADGCQRHIADDRPRDGFSTGHRTGHRGQHALRRLRPAPDQYAVHAAEPVPRDPRGAAALPAGSEPAQQAVHPVGGFKRSERPGRFNVVRRFRIIVCGIERHDGLRPLHPCGEYAGSALERSDYIEQCPGHERQDIHPGRQRRAARRLRFLPADHRTTLDYAPGTVSRRDGLVQSCARSFARKRHHRDRQGGRSR